MDAIVWALTIIAGILLAGAVFLTSWYLDDIARELKRRNDKEDDTDA